MKSNPVTTHIWDHVQPKLAQTFGANVYDRWMQNLNFSDLHGGRLYLSVPSRFVRDWLSLRCKKQLLELFQRQDDTIHSLEFIIETTAETSSSPKPAHLELITRTEADQPAPSLPAMDESRGLDKRYTFDRFVVGKPNELAFAAAQRVADAESVYFNPLFLYGSVGLGKTHLMHAIAWHIKENHPTRKVLYMSAEQFMYRFVRALRHKDIHSFREQFRSVDVLMIDDIQFISGKDSTQEEFFHTFNALIDQKKQIVLSADKSPSHLDGIQERVRSRLGWGLVADFHPSTYELRLGILESKIEKMDLHVSRDILEFLAHKITSNIRELEGALNRLAAHAALIGQEVTMESAKKLLKDLLQANDRQLTIEDIQTRVAAHFNIRVADMHSAKRLQVLARPRQIAMYLSKMLTTKSLPEIGRSFGGRDHTTVMHAVKKVLELKDKDPSFRQDVEMLENMIQR